MSTYSAQDAPVLETDVAAVASDLKPIINELHGRGYDGRDVALGLISALRIFVLECVGAEAVQGELEQLAEEVSKKGLGY